MSTTTIEYFQALRESGLDEKIAGAIVKIMEETHLKVVSDAHAIVESKELATKSDLRVIQSSLEMTRADLKAEIEKLRYDTLKFIVWTGAFVVFTLGGMIVSLGIFIVKVAGWW